MTRRADTMLRSRAARRTSAWLAAGLILGLAGCEKQNKDQTKAKPDDQSGGGKSDDDLQVVESIPMGLMPLGYADEALPNSLARVAAGSNGYGDFGTDVKDLGHGKIKDPFGKDGLDFSLSIAETPARVGAELAALMNGTVKVLFDQIFGKDGAFKAANFDVKKDKDGVVHRHVRFAQPIAWGAASYEYASLRAKQPGDAEEYTVELWGAAADAGEYMRLAWIGFTPAATAGDGTVSFHIDLSLGADAAAGRQVVDGRYDTATGVLSATFGKFPTVETEPAITAVAYDIGSPTKPSTIAGAYAWSRTSALPTGLLPRYYALANDDLEAFRAVTSVDGAASSEDLAFVPVEARAAIDATKPQDIFAQHSYPPMIQSFVLKLVRDPAYYPDCTKGGDEFRAGFSGNTAPEAVKNAPSNICAANTAYSDADLLAMLTATCAMKQDVNLPVKYASGATESLGLCSKLREGNLLANPVRIGVEGGARTILETTTDDAAHAPLAAILAGLPLPALPTVKDPADGLESESAATDEEVAASEFADAVYLP